jgi:hypothetical protein
LVLVEEGLRAGEVESVGDGVKVGEIEGLGKIEGLDFVGDYLIGDQLGEEGESNAEEGSEDLAKVGAVVFLLYFNAFVEEGSEGVLEFEESVGFVGLTIIICVGNRVHLHLLI